MMMYPCRILIMRTNKITIGGEMKKIKKSNYEEKKTSITSDYIFT